MHCPVCGHEDTKVVDSRIANEGATIRRRRECGACEYRFSTGEEIELLDLVVVKRNGHRENYHREKLERGLRSALEKRPITEMAFRSLMQGVERDIQKKRSNELTSADIGEIVMGRLEHFDKVAYIRFASVYRQFEDVASFKRELDRLGPRRSKQKKQK